MDESGCSAAGPDPVRTNPSTGAVAGLEGRDRLHEPGYSTECRNACDAVAS